MFSISEEKLQELEAIHRQVDGLVAQMETRLGPVLVCGPGCSSCCQDNLTVLEIEAALIAARAPRLLREEEPGPAGGCAFLDGQGRCRIYPWRPYVCRTQGLPLRWLTGDEGEAEGRDICPLNRDEMAARGQDPADLPVEQCWTLGPWEGRLASLSAEATGQFAQRRYPLRSLFKGGR